MPSMPVVSNVTQQMIERVSAMSKDWVGSGLSLPPALTERKWSFMFRFPVLVNENRPRALLVKIARMQGMNLEQSVSHQSLIERTEREYKMLKAIEGVFSTPDKESKGFVYIRPLALFHDLNAIVMEELDCKPLKDYFSQMGFLSSNEQQDEFEFLLRRSAGWLREYHRGMSEPQQVALGEAGLREKLDAACRGLSRVIPAEKLRNIQKGILEAIGAVKNETIPFAMVHGDYHCSNIMVTPSHQVCSLDADFLRAPAYEDLAKFLIDLETRGLQTLLNGQYVRPSLVKRFQSAIEDVYFENAEYNRLVLEIFITLALIYKWKIDEDVLNQSGMAQKIVRTLLAPWRRWYFSNLIQKRLEKLGTLTSEQTNPGAGGLS